MKNYTVRDIAEIGIFTGLAIVLSLSFFEIRLGVNGGSISFAIIPLVVIALRHSWWKTFIACVVIFSPIACLTSGNPIISLPFDYMCGYGSIVLLSLVRKNILKESKSSYMYLIVSLVVVTTIRFFFSTLSGVLFFETKFVPSMAYNAPFIFASGGIALVVMILLLKPLKIINKKYNNRNTNNN